MQQRFCGDSAIKERAAVLGLYDEYWQAILICKGGLSSDQALRTTDAGAAALH